MPGKLKVQGVEEEGSAAMEEGEGFNLNELIGTDSLSKGVFGFRGKRQSPSADKPQTPEVWARIKKSKKSQKKVAKKDEDLEGEEDFTMFLDGDEGLAKRYDTFRTLWKKVHSVYAQLLQENFAGIIESVGKFINEAGTAPYGNDFSGGGFGTELEIPTACILSGINVPDHADFFRQLKASLLSKPSSAAGGLRPFVASIKSKDCSASSIKSLLKVAFAQLSNSAADSADSGGEDEDENEEKGEDSAIGRKVSPRALRTWYHNQVPEGTTDKPPPLVFILEDFEGFPPLVLQDLIHNLRLLALPVVLVFGVATTVDAVHRSLPHAVTSSLAIRKFASAPSVKLLAGLVRSLTLDTYIPFKLGGESMKTLLETFMFHDFSVKHFLMSYKFCMLEHFMSNPGTCLIPPRQEKKVKGQGGVDKKTSAFLSSLPSVKRHVDENGAIKDMQDFLDQQLPRAWEAVSTFNLFADCLCAMSSTEFLPRHTLGKFFHSVYTLAMQESIQSTPDYRDLFKYFNLMEKTALARHLAKMVDCLGHSDLPAAKEATKSAKGFADELQALDTVGKESSKSATPQQLTSPPPTSSGQKKKLDRFALQEALLAQAKEAKAAKQSPFERLRNKIVDFYHATFKAALASPCRQQVPLHEVFVFNDGALISARLQGTPRTALQKSLQAPHFYIEDESVRIEGLDEIPPSLPDISIAYKLHLECGRYINLVDWFQCWLSIVEAKPIEEEDEEAGSLDPRLHARFNRAVSELQFLGFIRPSKRKTDHVERLTWNS